MLVLVVVAIALGGALWKVRAAGGAPREREGKLGWALAYAAVIASMGPLLIGAPRFVAADAILPSDAQAHAWVAAEVARGIPHGWVAVCSGGFPFGAHYQSVALVLAAALMRVGIAPITAVNALGLTASLALPLLVVSCARAG